MACIRPYDSLEAKAWTMPLIVFCSVSNWLLVQELYPDRYNIRSFRVFLNVHSRAGNINR